MKPFDILIEGKDRITIMTIGENAPVYVFGVEKFDGPYAVVVGVMSLDGIEAIQLARKVHDCVSSNLLHDENEAFVRILNKMDEWAKSDSDHE